MSKEQLDFVKLGVVYSAFTFVLSNVIANDFKSDDLHYIMGTYPFGVGLLFWPVIGYIYAGLNHPFDRTLCLSAVVAYDYGLIDRAINYDSEAVCFLERVWRTNRLGLMILAVVYLGGQLLIVSLLFEKLITKPRAR